MSRYGNLVEEQRRAVVEGKGETAPELRRAVYARAVELSGGPAAPADNSAAAIPEGLRRLVDDVALHAYRVTDEDVAALRRAGRSEDEVFEVAVAAAVGAGLARLERGLAALRGGGR